MQNIQEIFARIQDNKKKMKELKETYKDVLVGSMEYQELREKITTMRERKKQIEQTLKHDFSSEITKIDDLKIDIASDQELLSDVALTQVMQGETIAVKDEYDNQYEPVFTVKFKKIN